MQPFVFHYYIPKKIKTMWKTEEKILQSVTLVENGVLYCSLMYELYKNFPKLQLFFLLQKFSTNSQNFFFNF